VSKRGFYCDGYGLYLQVTASGTKSWVYRLQRNGVTRMMRLSSANTSSVVTAAKSLTGARQRAQERARASASRN
jgi:Arm DNA-binding domain